jgi:pheromone shutdown protein TraB
VEKCKQKDLLEEMLAEMTGEFPALSYVFVHERDLYLAHSLALAAQPVPTPYGVEPAKVVGVVGIGHVPGIVAHWGKVGEEDITPILR